MLRTTLSALALSAAAGAALADCETVVFSDVGWTDITATTAATVTVLEALGYDTDVKVLSVPVTYTSLANGDVDIFLGNWMPTMEADIAPYREAGTVDTVRANLEGAKYTLAVNKAAADLGIGGVFDDVARMLAEARSKGYDNALVADALGNVAETASANIFMVRDGEVLTPISNGTFLAGITRARHISNMQADGIKVREAVLTFKDFEDADEVFLTGNMSKITPVKAVEDRTYQVGPVARRLREMYWDWAATQTL